MLLSTIFRVRVPGILAGLQMLVVHPVIDGFLMMHYTSNCHVCIPYVYLGGFNVSDYQTHNGLI